MKAGAAWGAILLLAIILIIAGFQGSGGKILAVIFVPGSLVVTKSGSTSSSTIPGIPGVTPSTISV